MPSVTERIPLTPARRRALDTFELWNRKIHYYLGLYLLFFLWLFALTGLLLNHPGWTFADFWPNRRESLSERTIQLPKPVGDYSQARDLMRQIGITGEIEWTAVRNDANLFKFRVSRPGHLFEVEANFGEHRAKVKRIDLNAWGVMHILHTFTGVRIGDTRNQRDWVLTTLWALTMDGLALGLIVMVLTSLFMWWRVRKKRLFGFVALTLGVLLCGLFAVGLKSLT